MYSGLLNLTFSINEFIVKLGTFNMLACLLMTMAVMTADSNSAIGSNGDNAILKVILFHPHNISVHEKKKKCKGMTLIYYVFYRLSKPD